MKVSEIFSKCGMETKITQNLMGCIWNKLLINSSINAISALIGLENGTLLTHPHTRSIMIASLKEGLNICKRLGIDLEVEDPTTNMIRVAKITSRNRSSMLQDIDNGKKTEIGYINGKIVEYGKSLRISTPVNEALTVLIEAIEKNRNTCTNKRTGMSKNIGVESLNSDLLSYIS